MTTQSKKNTEAIDVRSIECWQKDKSLLPEVKRLPYHFLVELIDAVEIKEPDLGEALREHGRSFM